MKITLTEVLDKVETAFPPLRETARLVLTVAATTRLNREHPLAVILIGAPSSGKTSLLMPLTKGKKDSALASSVLRIDDFTPASLVSHASNKTPEQLAKIDLLPRMSTKCVIVKEMAPMFTGKDEDLMKKFGIFASILDGEGYISSSGSYGTRGYDEKITFSLLGAVTPEVLTQKVYNSLSAIGPRFCFWEMPPQKLDPIKWRGPSSDRKQIEADAVQAVVNFMEAIFNENPPGSIDRNKFSISEGSRETLSHIASLMALLRSKLSYEREDDGSFSQSGASTESPDRAFRYLEQLVLGSAFIEGRFEICDRDLVLALGVALGSTVPKLRRVIRLFFTSDQPRSTHDICAYLSLTDDTAAKYAAQLCSLEVISKVNIDGTTLWDLKSPFRELRHLLAIPEVGSPLASDPPLNIPHVVSPGLFDFEDTP